MNFVAVQTFVNYVDAHIAKGVLEENGITTWLRDEHTLTIDPLLIPALGGIKLMVPEEDAQRAVNILAQLHTGEKTFITCPECGSRNIEDQEESTDNNSVFKCNDCGKTFALNLQQ